MDGVLNVDKPAGMTSHDVVARVRRALKTKRVGHAGTLDPDAVGVLVVAVGQATRLLPFLPLEPKEYVARVVLGVATDTEDASGRITAQVNTSAVTEQRLRDALPAFVGQIAQIPPMVSAVHHEGQRLYALARKGIVVERKPRTVTIHSLAMGDFTRGAQAEATLRVVCGGGTYVRTLCADIGAALGVPAHLQTLVREAVGRFRREQATDLDTLTPEKLLPVEEALDLPAADVSDEDAARLDRGQPVAAKGATKGDIVLLNRGRLRALARYEDGVLLPFKVFLPPNGSDGEHGAA